MNIFKLTLSATVIAGLVFSNSADAVQTKLTSACKPFKPQIDISKIERKTQLLQEQTYKVMSKVQEPIGREAYDEAIAMLMPFIEKTENKPYDNALVRQQISNLYASKKDWAKALQHAKASLEKEVLPASQELQLRNNIMYFYMAAENYSKALEAAVDYFKYAPEPSADNFATFAYVHHQAGKVKESLCPMNQAMEMSKDVKKTWYDFLYSVHAELDDFEGAATVLMEALPKYPDTKIYWQQLPQLYLKLGRDADALAFMELAYKKGLLEKEADLKNLAALYGQFDAPYKAASLMTESLKKGTIKADERNWKATGQNWSLAKEYEKAIDAYGEAAKFVSDGTYFQYQGEIYTELEKWKEAASAFSKALEKGGLKDPGRTYLSLGISNYNAGNINSALANLEKATQYDKARNQAAQWIQFINQKIASK